MRKRGWLAVVMALTPALAQQKPTAPPAPPPQPGPPPADWSRNLDKGLNSSRYEFRIPMNVERLAGPENLTRTATVTELEKLLDSYTGKSDEKLAEAIAKFALTERVSHARLEAWKRRCPGTESRQALLALADAAEFLDLPPGDVSSDPAPTIAEQRRMMAALGAYLGKALPALPNFLATRKTVYFEDWPSHVDWPTAPGVPDSTDTTNALRMQNRPFYLLGKAKSTVTYRDGREVPQTRRLATADDPYQAHLTTRGEFGPILVAVVSDAAQAQLTFKEWEASEDGRLAVFRFAVPQGKSHYMVKSLSGKDEQPQAYKGEIAIRPADGSVMRLTVRAEMPQDTDVQVAGIHVQYGTVEIGGKNYICPVHGVALTKVPIKRQVGKARAGAPPLQTQVNDVSFEEYHVFRSSSRIASVDKSE